MVMIHDQLPALAAYFAVLDPLFELGKGIMTDNPAVPIPMNPSPILVAAGFTPTIEPT
jgi:hypothetical protein